jgi:hypothetical protein
MPSKSDRTDEKKGTRGAYIAEPTVQKKFIDVDIIGELSCSARFNDKKLTNHQISAVQ